MMRSIDSLLFFYIFYNSWIMHKLPETAVHSVLVIPAEQCLVSKCRLLSGHRTSCARYFQNTILGVILFVKYRGYIFCLCKSIMYVKLCESWWCYTPVETPFVLSYVPINLYKNCYLHLQWSLRFKTPPFNNSFHFKIGHPATQLLYFQYEYPSILRPPSS